MTLKVTITVEDNYQRRWVVVLPIDPNTHKGIEGAPSHEIESGDKASFYIHGGMSLVITERGGF
jgi:hypothetical protein